MKINKLSDNFTPLHEGILFSIECEDETPTDLFVEIIAVSSGEVVATQLLRNTLSARVNIAPYMEHFTDYQPTLHTQALFREAPTAAYKIRVNGIESEEVIVSINRCTIDATPTIVSSLPSSRRISYGESDEVVILTGQDNRIYVEMESKSGEAQHFDYTATTNATILTISPDIFETPTNSFEVVIYCDGAIIGILRYTIVPTLKDSIRLAWISESGAIERYSFPTAHKRLYATEKRSLMTNEGITTAHCRAEEVISLCSRLESCATIEALAQIAFAPKVWIEHNEGYNLVDVATTNIEQNLFGEPSHLHIDICLWQKEVSL